MEHVNDRPAAQPTVGPGETPEEVREHLFSLPVGEQVDVLRQAAPRVLGRLQQADREAFVAALRRAPREEAEPGAPSAPEPIEPADKVLRDWMEQPPGVQQHLLHLVAPRIVAALDTGDREALLRELEESIRRVEEGAPAPL